jgi:hypothetical protein
MTEQQYQADPLTEEEFRAWKHHQTTCKIYHLLRQHQAWHKTQLLTGCPLGLPSADKIVQQYAKTLGIIEGMDKFLEMEVADYD